MITKRRIVRATLTAAAVLIGAQAYANTVAFFARPGNFPVAGPVYVELNANGATSVTFTGSGRRTIVYTAECFTSASWLTIAIIVDNVQLAPTGNNTADSFCSSHSGFVMAAAMGRTADLPDGTHTVRILASLQGTGSSSLGDSALAIMR